MPVAHDANAAYSDSPSDAKATPSVLIRTLPSWYGRSGREARPAGRARPADLAGRRRAPGAGGYRTLEAGSAPAPPRVLGPGSGPQPTLDRTPARGFPPPPSGYQQPA